jgi:carboxyl-terminal processing protease
MTIGKYYRITGESTQHRGVMPDIELPSHIDLQLVGESTRKTALPWDTIRTAKFKPYNPALENAIPSLSKKSISRKKTNDDLRFLIKEIEKLKNFRAKKMISLNLKQREQERNTEIQDQLKRGNERISILNLELGIEAPDFIKSLEELEQLDLPEVDINLNEAAEIAADLILLNNDTLITKNN